MVMVRHLRSSILISGLLPGRFNAGAMKWLDIGANVVASGIAIAIGTW